MSSTPLSSAIILARPQLGENIGACARVMCNFNLSDLRIIAPRDGWPNEKALDMAKSAKHIIEKATIYETLEEALSDIEFLYATTVRPRYMVKPVYTPRKAIDEIYKHAHHKSAILFGPERSGLSNDEIALANAIITVPVGSEYDSLNLAQAVAIMAYEHFMIAQNAPHDHMPLGNTHFASRKDIAHLLNHLEEELDNSGFFFVPQKREHMRRNIRNLFARTHLTDQDVRTLRGIIRSLAHRATNH